MTDFEIYKLSQKPALIESINLLSRKSWPEFLLHGDVRHWSALFDKFRDYQLLFCDDEDTLIAVGHTVPLCWDGTNEDLPDDIDTILKRAIHDFDNKRRPTGLCALAIMVDPEYRGQGLSRKMIIEMKKLAGQHGMPHLLAPVRPTLKQAYPRVSFKKYITWQRKDGAPFDHWLRVHWRLGAKIAKVIPRSLTVTGSIADWQKWTGHDFPSSGDYEIAGALRPVHVDIEKDKGMYDDPNVWMVHDVG